MRTILFVLFCALTVVVVNAKPKPKGGPEKRLCTTSEDCPTTYACIKRGRGTKNDRKVCVFVDCRAPPAPGNGTADAPSGTTFNETATLSCNEDYVLIGDSSLTCLETGEWEKSDAVCTDRCQDLDVPDNGYVCIPDGTFIGEEAIISCDAGYKLNGNSPVTCYETGYWSGSGECIVSQCGVVISVDVPGVFVSPNYPGYYDNNEGCTWILTAPEGYGVSLTFNAFKTEVDGSCIFDYLVVHDGSTECDPLLGRYCGDGQPDPITSTSNSLYVRFTSDSSVTDTGFSIIYSKVTL